MTQHPSLYQQGSSPITILATYDYLGEADKIIATNFPTFKDAVLLGKPIIKDARVFCTRFWSTSDCTITLMSSIPAQGIPLDLPYENIYSGQQISVWLGYVMTTLEAVKYKNHLRVFIGEIDNISYQFTANSIIITIKARDRMKFLLDSVIYYSPIQLKEFAAKEAGSGTAYSRSKLLLEIAKLAVADSSASADASTTTTSTTVGAGITIEKDDTFTYDMQGTEGAMSVSAAAWYAPNGEQVGVLSGAASFVEQKVSLNPKFRIFTQRPPINVYQTSTFIVQQQVPIEMIKYLAMQEVYPTEVFQDQRDGNLYYCPRANDSSGIATSWTVSNGKINYEGGDAARNYRVYFVACHEVDLAPEATRIIRFKQEESIIALKTNFFVEIGNNSNSVEEVKLFHLATRPWKLRGKSIAAKVAAAVDPLVKGANEAAIIAIMLARVWGRETRAAVMVVPGDPSLTPGEIVQVVSPMRRNYNDDLRKFTEYNTAWNDHLATLAKLQMDESSTTISSEINNQNASVYLSGNMTPQPTNQTGSTSPTANLTADYFAPEQTTYMTPDNKVDGLNYGFAEEPESVWRIESVIHKMTERGGYVTEVMLLSPF